MKFKNIIIISGFGYGCYIAGKYSGIVKAGKALNKTVGENKQCTIMYDILKNEVTIDIVDKEKT